jgi:prepilin-type N-terminal cleavage/methylation domain-containing protein
MLLVRHQNKKEKAFTLIELLVVIAIIALLASIVLVALNGARQKSRVTTRLADLTQISKALELYYADNGSYPSGGWYSQCAAWGGLASSQVVPGLVPSYLAAIPSDPAMNASANQNCLLYLSNGVDYKVMVYGLTDMTPAQIAQYPTFVDPDRNTVGVANCGNNDNSGSLAIWTPGARCF